MPHANGPKIVSRYLIILHSPADRLKASQIISAAPFGTRVEIKAAKRSNDQNAKMWCLLSEIALQLPWHGTKLRADDWKIIFLSALKRELRMVPNLDNSGFVNLGQSSSDLTKGEMSEMIELIAAFGAQHGVKFSDQSEAA